MQREFKISLSQEFYSDIVYLSQYDSDYPVIFTVTDKYSKASGINGYTAKFTGTRGDGTGLGFTYTATAIGHTVSFTIDTMLTGVAGTHAGEIIFYDQNGLYFGTTNVQIIVEPAARPDGTIDADEEELRDLAQQCQDIVDTAAAEVKGEAEAWAVGQRDGEDVPSTDPTYENNAKFYAEQAAQIAEDISGVTEQVAQNTSDISDLKEDLNIVSNHFIGSINLFNPDDPDLVEDVELNGSGTTSAKTGYFASGYIPVRAGQTVCCHYPVATYGGASKFIWYNANKERISYNNVPAENRLIDANGYSYIKYTFGETVSAAYFRLTGYMAGESYYMYVYADSMPSTYVPYTDDFSLSDDVTVDFSNIKNVSISKSDTDFVKSNPKNLNDLSAMVTGVISNASTNGDLDTSVTTWMSTDYIPVKPNHKYTFVDSIGVYYGANHYGYPYYTKDKTYIGRIVPDGGKASTTKIDALTIPDNNQVAYIRISYPKAFAENHKQWYKTMIVEGSTWVGYAYIPYDGAVRVQGAGLSTEFSAPLNCLFGKMAIWNGDSICAADNDPNGGWALTIAKANGMQAKNYGIAGGTIAENTGVNVHSVSLTLDGMLTDFPNADYIIIEGGTNDADILGDSGIGTFDADDFTDTYINGLDKNTFSGALESIFYRLVTVMKGKHIGYLIPQKMGHTEVLVTRRRAYFDRAIEICQKWGIPYLDLWNNLYFNWRLSAHWDQSMTEAENNEANNFYRDGQHLTDYGYAVESPIIAEWMKTI